MSHPDWLFRRLIEHELPWDKKPDLNIETFLTKYTLHDSYLIGIFSHDYLEQRATLAFEWDPVWLPDEIAKSSPTLEGWLYLFIKIDKVDQISSSKLNIGDANSPRPIAGAWLEVIEGRKYLAIQDIYGGQVDIIFSGDVSFLAIEPNERILNI
jgi:hypothetical protein